MRGSRFGWGIKMDWLDRTQLLFGEDNINKLRNARVAVFGIGGVGGYTVEALARSGIGTLDLFDDDKICLTNINRQLHATHKNIGEYKVDAARERVLEINPEAKVNARKLFYMPESSHEVDFTCYDYIVDAIDTVTGKLELVLKAREAGVRIISAMGAGNKINPAALEVCDIYKTEICPLARVMRRELRKRGIETLKVVYSREEPVNSGGTAGCGENCVCPPDVVRKCTHRRVIPGSTAFVPATAGLIIAGEVVRDLIN